MAKHHDLIKELISLEEQREDLVKERAILQRCTKQAERDLFLELQPESDLSIVAHYRDDTWIVEIEPGADRVLVRRAGEVIG